MEEWAGKVALGRIVCAVNEYALVFISSSRFGMGASSIASGRSPSILRMITRWIARLGVGVVVTDGEGCAVSDGDANVAVGFSVGCGAVTVAGVDIWQASKNSRARMGKAG